MILIAMLALFAVSMTWTGLLVRSAWRSHFRARTVARVKILTPLDDPMGSTIKLIEWAEQRGIAEHRAVFGDDGLSEVDQARERFLEENRKGQVTILDEHDFRTPNERRESAGYTRMAAGDYGRYLDGIGYVTASSPELLNRACQTVLTRKYDEFHDTLITLDRRIAAYGLSSSQAPRSLREQRSEAWEKAKATVEAIQALYDQHVGPEPITDNTAYSFLMSEFYGTDSEIRQHSHWVMSYDWFNRIRKLNDPQGHPYWTPAVHVDGPEHLMGLPVQLSQGGGLPHLEGD